MHLTLKVISQLKKQNIQTKLKDNEEKKENPCPPGQALKSSAWQKTSECDSKFCKAYLQLLGEGRGRFSPLQGFAHTVSS